MQVENSFFLKTTQMVKVNVLVILRVVRPNFDAEADAGIKADPPGENLKYIDSGDKCPTQL